MSVLGRRRRLHVSAQSGSLEWLRAWEREGPSVRAIIKPGSSAAAGAAAVIMDAPQPFSDKAPGAEELTPTTRVLPQNVIHWRDQRRLMAGIINGEGNYRGISSVHSLFFVYLISTHTPPSPPPPTPARVLYIFTFLLFPWFQSAKKYQICFIPKQNMLARNSPS